MHLLRAFLYRITKWYHKRYHILDFYVQVLVLSLFYPFVVIGIKSKGMRFYYCIPFFLAKSAFKCSIHPNQHDIDA